jgi:hypothetical protein
MDEIRSSFDIFNAEQLAFSLMLGLRSNVNLCQDIIRHYWGFERRFCHAQLSELFPDFTKERFESYLSNVPKIGSPAKRPIDQIKARLKQFFRSADAQYRFAYVAYLSALSSRDPVMANVWANTAADVIKFRNIDPQLAISDFPKLPALLSNIAAKLGTPAPKK